jgi:3-oxoacyl-(acyl-carrier-protein) synthase
MAEGLQAALKEAKIEAKEIGIIGLAANGVDELERGEALALEEVFGPQWQQIPRIPLRYFVGEFGSGGLLTAATILLSLAEGTIPPTVRGPALTGLAGKSQRFAPVKKESLVAGMAIGSTFGGGSACVVFGRQQGK